MRIARLAATTPLLVGALVTMPAPAARAAWVRDSGRIAFYSDRMGDQFDIYAINPDGSDPVRLTQNAGSDFDPSYSPDGSKIAWTTAMATTRSGS